MAKQERPAYLQPLHLIETGFSRLHYWFAILSTEARNALNRQIEQETEHDVVTLRPSLQATALEREHIARAVARAVAEAPVSIQAKRDWLALCGLGLSITSNGIHLMRHLTPDQVAHLPPYLYDGTYTVAAHPDHSIVSELMMALSDFYYAASDSVRLDMRYLVPRANIAGGGYSAASRDGAREILPYVGTPAAVVGARSA